MNVFKKSFILFLAVFVCFSESIFAVKGLAGSPRLPKCQTTFNSDREIQAALSQIAFMASENASPSDSSEESGDSLPIANISEEEEFRPRLRRTNRFIRETDTQVDPEKVTPFVPEENQFEDTCAICQENLCSNDENGERKELSKTICDHIFHQDCFKEYSYHNRTSTSIACPLCRIQLSE